jgi:hypothetical protein
VVDEGNEGDNDLVTSDVLIRIGGLDVETRELGLWPEAVLPAPGQWRGYDKLSVMGWPALLAYQQ